MTDLANKLAYADQHTSEMQNRAHRARLRVLNQYSIEAVAGQYEDLYKKLLGTPPSEIVQHS